MSTNNAVLLHRQGNQKYRDRHPQRIKKQSKTYYQKNKKRIIAYVKKWTAAHPGKMAEYGRNHRLRMTPKEKQKWRNYRKRWNKTHPEYRRKKAADRLRRVRAWLKEYKLERGCIDCGYKKCAAALDFDHVRGKKKFNVGNAQSFASAKREINKCVVRCRNCHAERTWKKKQHLH